VKYVGISATILTVFSRKYGPTEIIIAIRICGINYAFTNTLSSAGGVKSVRKRTPAAPRRYTLGFAPRNDYAFLSRYGEIMTMKLGF